MTKTVLRWVGLLVMALGAADCSVIERSGTVPYSHDSAGIYFRRPKAWSVAGTKDGFTVKISSSATITYSSQKEARDNPVEATDRAADATLKQLQKDKWEASLGASQRADGTYIRAVNAKLNDKKQRTWIIAVPHDFKDYLLTYSASSSEFNSHLPEAEKLISTLEFIKDSPVLYDNLLFTVTTKNYVVFMFLVIALIAVLFLWKDFWVDLWRLVVAPGDVFRDVGRGAMIAYPILVVFVTGMLLTATVLSYRNTFLQNADTAVTAMAKLRSMPAIEKATDDPDARLIMLYDVRRRGLAPYEDLLGMIPFWMPLLPLVAWFMTAVGMFFGIKIARGQTTFLWVLKGSAFLFVPQFFSGFGAIHGFFSGNLAGSIVGGVFGLWGLYLMFVAARELGHFRRGEALVAVIVTLILLGLTGFGIGYYWGTNYAPKFVSGYKPNTTLIRNLQVGRAEQPEGRVGVEWMV